MKQLVPSIKIDIDSDQPYIFSLLGATSQSISVDIPGGEPCVTNKTTKEDCKLLFGDVVKAEIHSSVRRKMLQDPAVAARYTFNTEFVYTFDFYQHLLDIGTYSMNAAFSKVDLTPSLNNQPIQVLSKTKDGRYLWSFDIWHENCLE
uniref:Domain of unknown function at the cortex 1 domain-containing protein n=1 Tax=Corethron hystrix TaxID=216773 RepID=A0A7S1BVM1_9STRA|mmetsp:Transcript_40461/g.95054  ORF Transcript_40461/g.95054 Transcript_40461/m.95054 type:complete len:147 (+) Transcript_40461:480-920(+)